MKRFLVSLLAIGLILAIGMPAAAQVKFSGQYTYEGWYENNRRLAPNEQSTGFQDHTLLLNAQFKAAEGLTLYTERGSATRSAQQHASTTGVRFSGSYEYARRAPERKHRVRLPLYESEFRSRIFADRFHSLDAGNAVSRYR